MTSSNFSSSIFSIILSLVIPAQLTKTLAGSLYSSAICLTRFRTMTLLETSNANAWWNWWLNAASSGVLRDSKVVLARSKSMSVVTTLAPCLAKSSQTARPMPLPPPSRRKRNCFKLFSN